MAAWVYEDALTRLLQHEGGYSNHPDDPGGPTNFGITIADYRKYVNPSATAADVRAMPLADAKTIYRAKYWDALNCDQLPAGVDYSVFDYGVNSGIGRSGKVLRRVCGLTDESYTVNAHVMAAVNERAPAALAAAICDERLAFLKRLATWHIFGKGWGRRVAEVRQYSIHLTTQQDGGPVPLPKPKLSEPSKGKGAVPEPKATKDAIKVGTGTVAAGGGIGFADWVMQHPVEAGLILAATAMIVCVAIYAVNRWREHRQDAAIPETRFVPVTK